MTGAAPDDTRAALIRVARDAFAERGYAGTHLEDVAAAMGLTKGAIYHHFGSKAELFGAVRASLEQALLHRVEAALRAASPGWPRVEAALDAYLDASAEPAYARVVLVEAAHAPAPSPIDRAVGHRLVRDLLEELASHDVLRPLPLDVLARVLRAALDEVALAMAEASDVARARADGRAVLRALLEGLARGRTRA